MNTNEYLNLSKAEKENLIEKVIRAANKEQRELVEKYKKKNGKNK